MANIKITFRDGHIQEFKHIGRPGGSYTKTVKYEGAFVIITDEWGTETAFPSDTVKSVENTPTRW